MLQDVEGELKKYFGAAWNEPDVLAWIGAKRFVLDVPAIDENLRAPVGDFILRGGKRLRPVLFLTILKLLGADWKRFLRVAVALELAHNGTLLIDDIEDSAELRRGKPTCHRTFGLDTAVNAGVTMHALPLALLLQERELPEGVRLRLAEIYAEEITNVYFGQTLDIAWHKAPRCRSWLGVERAHAPRLSESPQQECQFRHEDKGQKESVKRERSIHPQFRHGVDEYLEMTRLKTGGLIRMASRAACAIAGREDLEQAIVDFSELAGIAFQIKDDALEYAGAEETFGKSFGNDISEGKMSLPVTFALQKLSPEDRAWLLETLGAHTKEKEPLQKAMNLIKETGAVDEALAYAEKLVDDSWRLLEPKLSGMPEVDVAAFKELTYFLVKRAV